MNCNSRLPDGTPTNAFPQYHAPDRTNQMQVETAKRLFSVDEYYQMAEVGILGPEDRVELIDGQIIKMCPISNRHLGCVNKGTEVFVGAFRGRAVVSVQNPLRLTNFTEPQPDIVLLKP